MLVLRPLLYCCLFFLSIVSFYSCGIQHNGSDQADASTDIRQDEASRYLGVYSGGFNKGIMTLVLNYISGSTVSGYNVHKGLRRNINGQVVRDGNKLNFVLKEPGDNPFDGTFYFSLDTAKLKISGKWVPLDSSKLKTRTITLSKKRMEQFLDSVSYEWATTSGMDTTLSLKPDGTCELSFYQNPLDSTSQMIDVHGNFIIVRDTVKIEWQKNTYFPSTLMKLVRTLEKDSSGEYDHLYLRGNGLKFTPIMD